MEIAEKLAKYAHSVNFKNLPPKIIHEVKRRIIDSMGCSFGSLATATIKKLQTYFEKNNNFPTICDMSFIAGASTRYLDYNDTYLSKEPAHPSDNISALLSLAVSRECSGKDLITAIALSYEIQCRLCDAASLRKKGWDHVIYIPISVVCGASKLLKLNLKKTRHAIALAATSNVSLRQTRIGELSEWKGLAAANAARNGLWTVFLAEAGISGPDQIFEGEHGFLKQVIQNDFAPEFYRFLEEKPQPQKILETYIKFYPIEYHIQAVAEAVLKLRKSHPQLQNINAIDSITVETYEAAVTIVGKDKAKWDPKTRETADHSIPYITAVALIDGEVWLNQFSEERIKDKKLRPLMNKISVRENPELTKIYGSTFPAMVKIKLYSGETFTKRINYPRGHPKNPMNDKEIEEKSRRLIELNPELKKNFTKENFTFENIWNLENMDPLPQIIKGVL